MCGGAQPDSPLWVQSPIEGAAPAPAPSPSPTASLAKSISMGGGGSSDVDQFCALTGADASTASQYIAENEDVRAAINAFFDTGGAGGVGEDHAQAQSTTSAAEDGSVTVACGFCGQHLSVPAGTPAVKCPKCGGVSRVNVPQ